MSIDVAHAHDAVARDIARDDLQCLEFCARRYAIRVAQLAAVLCHELLEVKRHMCLDALCNGGESDHQAAPWGIGGRFAPRKRPIRRIEMVDAENVCATFLGAIRVPIDSVRCEIPPLVWALGRRSKSARVPFNEYVEFNDEVRGKVEGVEDSVRSTILDERARIPLVAEGDLAKVAIYEVACTVAERDCDRRATPTSKVRAVPRRGTELRCAAVSGLIIVTVRIETPRWADRATINCLTEAGAVVVNAVRRLKRGTFCAFVWVWVESTATFLVPDVAAVARTRVIENRDAIDWNNTLSPGFAMEQRAHEQQRSEESHAGCVGAGCGSRPLYLAKLLSLDN